MGATGLDHHVRLSLAAAGPRRRAASWCATCSATSSDLPDELVDLVLDAADGNPFYVEELVTWLVDAGVIVRGDPHWRVVAELVGTRRGADHACAASSRPASTRSTRCSARCCSAPSVVGRVFWDAAVAHLADHGDRRRRRAVARRAAPPRARLRARRLDLRLGPRVPVQARRCSATWPTTACCAPTASATTASPASGWPRRRRAAAARTSSRPSSPSTSTRRATTAPRRVVPARRPAGRRRARARGGQPAARPRAGAARDDDLERASTRWSRASACSDYLGDRAAQQADLDTLDGLLARLPDDADQPRRRTVRADRAGPRRLRARQLRLGRARRRAPRPASRRAPDSASSRPRRSSCTASRRPGAATAPARPTSLTVRARAGARARGGAAGRRVAALPLDARQQRGPPRGGARPGRGVRRGVPRRRRPRGRGDGAGAGRRHGVQHGPAARGPRRAGARAADLPALGTPLPRGRGARQPRRDRQRPGRVRRARGSWLRQAIEVKRRLQDTESLCVDLLILGMVEGSTGGFDAAIAALEEARQIGASLEGRSQEIDAHSRLALVHLNRGDVRAAKKVSEGGRQEGGLGGLSARPRHGAPRGGVRRDGRRQPARRVRVVHARPGGTTRSPASDVLAREARAGTAAAQSALGHHPAAVAAIEALLPTLQTAGAEGSLRPDRPCSPTSGRCCATPATPGRAAALRRARRYVRAHRRAHRRRGDGRGVPGAADEPAARSGGLTELRGSGPKRRNDERAGSPACAADLGPAATPWLGAGSRVPDHAWQSTEREQLPSGSRPVSNRPASPRLRTVLTPL